MTTEAKMIHVTTPNDVHPTLLRARADLEIMRALAGPLEPRAPVAYPIIVTIPDSPKVRAAFVNASARIEKVLARIRRP